MPYKKKVKSMSYSAFEVFSGDCAKFYLFEIDCPSLQFAPDVPLSCSVFCQMESYESVMQRRDLSENIVEITHRNGTDQWLVVRKMLDASKISIQVCIVGSQFHLHSS